MAEASIPVDLTNPGQVFACLGFLEAADILLGDARGGFDWRNPADPRFRLAARGDDDPIRRALRFLDEATVTAVAAATSPHNIDNPKVEIKWDDSGVFPFRDTGPDVLPARLRDRSGNTITIDHWGDQGRVGRDRVKFWAGAGGYPGVNLVHDAINLIGSQATDYTDDPFSFSTKQSSSLRFDWRRDYVPIDAGFSPNLHKSTIKSQGYPIVELLAAIGLTNARPLAHNRMKYRYATAGVVGDNLYDPIFLRAALGALKPTFPGMPFRLFTMRLGLPGGENNSQIRCITDATEETVLS